MIEIKSVTKTFEKKKALNDFSCKIESGSIFGLVGSNGAGKSTLLRIMAGIYKPDSGAVYYDKRPVYENPKVKQSIFFIPDFPYFYSDSTIENTAMLYKSLYANWNNEKYNKLIEVFALDKKAKIINMSKGMQRQAALILALSCQPKFLLLDEIFDGLDPVIRQLLKKILIDSVTINDTTIIIASHNLRELEDVCDHVGLIHNGGVVLERELDDMKLGIHKIQAAFGRQIQPDAWSKFDIVNLNQRGQLFNLVIRGEENEIMQKIEELEPIFAERLPLTLEEIFISEMEVVGYDSKKFI